MTDQALRLAEQQHGVVTFQQLRRRGMTPKAIRHLTGSGQWRPGGRGVLVRNGSPCTPHQQLLIAVLDVDHRAVASHDSAAWLWGLAGFRPTPAHVSVCRFSATSSDPTTRLHMVRSLPRSWTTQHLGVPVVRPELLALQLFAIKPKRAAHLADRLWSDGLLSGGSIAALLSQLGERGRNGTAGLRIFLNERGIGYVPPASNLESRLNELLALWDISVRRQVDLGEAVWGGRVDFVCDAAPVVVEAQSEKYHSSLSDRAADERRGQRLETAGFTVVEVWDTDIFHRPTDAIRRIVAAVQNRAAR